MTLVSVSREEGSWGGDIARNLAARLGYRLLDQKALLEEAEAYGGLSRTAPELAEKRPGFRERLNQERRRYSVLLRAIVYRVALQDNVVFLGRGTGFLLGDVEHAFRLLVTCPLQVRIARIMERGAGGKPGPMPREQAEEIAKRADRDRAAYVKYLFQTDWLDPVQHSLVVSTDAIDVEAATDLVLRMIASGTFDTTPASRQRLEQLAQASEDEAARLVGRRR